MEIVNNAAQRRRNEELIFSKLDELTTLNKDKK